MIHKTYLSRAATRAMALDHPVGDPTGGAAYGERRDPISAIVSIATMAGTGGAVMAGTATLMQGLAFAGAAIGLVGNVTGNKTLSKIGMVTGIAGGIGMLAEGVMGQAIGGTMGETFGYGAGAANTASAAAPSLAQTPTAGPQTPVVDGVIEGVQTSPVNSVGEGVSRPLTSATGPAPGSLNAGPGAGAPSLNAGPGAAPLTGGADPFTARTATGLRALPGDAGALAPGFMDSLKAGKYMDALKTGGSNLMELTKSNPGAALMMGNAVGGVADWLSGKTDAEISALEAQTGYSNAAALRIQEEIAREKRRRANLNQSYGRIDTGIRVNTNASMAPGQGAPMAMPPGAQGAIPMQMPPGAAMPQRPGLIAGARPPGG